MIARLRPVAIPAYLLLCLLLGGSAQGIWSNAVLQLLAIAILAWAALTREPIELSGAGKGLFLLAGVLVLLFALQLAPLPPALWTQLPGRELVAEGYRLLGLPLPWLPISLAPYDTLAAALLLLPPLAVLAGMLRLGAYNENWLTAVLLLATLASVLVGVLQVSSGDPSWYFYRISAYGSAAGFFANSNHMAALMLVSVPFLAAMTADRWSRERDANSRSLIAALALSGAAVLGVGILLNGSWAILLLGAPVAAATVIMVLRPSGQRLRRGFGLVALLLVAGAAASGLLSKDGTSRGNMTSIETRTEFWSESAEAIGDHWLTGSGIGTFAQIYRQHEDPAEINRVYVNHAHNDYVEIALDAGVPGVVLLVLFLGWWTKWAGNAWRSPNATIAMKAASIASATLLLHSLVDYPLRTAGLSAVMAMCLALMAGVRAPRPPDQVAEARPARHVTL